MIAAIESQAPNHYGLAAVVSIVATDISQLKTTTTTKFQAPPKGLLVIIAGPGETGREFKSVRTLDTWEAILSDHPSFKDARSVWVAGRTLDPSATLAASGILGGTVVRVHFAPNLPRLPGGMIKHDTEQPLRKGDLEVFKHAFSQATGGLRSMTFEQSLLHPDISAWISDGSITEQRLGELWNQVVASQNTEVLGFMVSDNLNLAVFCSCGLITCPGVQQFLDFAISVEEEAESNVAEAGAQAAAEVAADAGAGVVAGAGGAICLGAGVGGDGLVARVLRSMMRVILTSLSLTSSLFATASMNSYFSSSPNECTALQKCFTVPLPTSKPSSYLAGPSKKR